MRSVLETPSGAMADAANQNENGTVANQDEPMVGAASGADAGSDPVAHITNKEGLKADAQESGGKKPKADDEKKTGSKHNPLLTRMQEFMLAFEAARDWDSDKPQTIKEICKLIGKSKDGLCLLSAAQQDPNNKESYVKHLDNDHLLKHIQLVQEDFKSHFEFHELVLVAGEGVHGVLQVNEQTAEFYRICHQMTREVRALKGGPRNEFVLAISSGLQSFLLPKILARTDPHSKKTLHQRILDLGLKLKLQHYESGTIQQEMADGRVHAFLVWGGHSLPKAEVHHLEHSGSEIRAVYHPFNEIAKLVDKDPDSPYSPTLPTDRLAGRTVICPRMRLMQLFAHAVNAPFEQKAIFLDPTTFPNIVNIVKSNLAIGILPVAPWLARELYREGLHTAVLVRDSPIAGLSADPVADDKRLKMRIVFHDDTSVDRRTRQAMKRSVAATEALAGLPKDKAGRKGVEPAAGPPAGGPVTPPAGDRDPDPLRKVVEMLKRECLAFFKEEREPSKRWKLRDRSDEYRKVFLDKLMGENTPLRLYHLDPTGDPGRDKSFWRDGTLTGVGGVNGPGGPDGHGIPHTNPTGTWWNGIRFRCEMSKKPGENPFGYDAMLTHEPKDQSISILFKRDEPGQPGHKPLFNSLSVAFFPSHVYLEQWLEEREGTSGKKVCKWKVPEDRENNFTILGLMSFLKFHTEKPHEKSYGTPVSGLAILTDRTTDLTPEELTQIERMDTAQAILLGQAHH